MRWVQLDVEVPRHRLVAQIPVQHDRQKTEAIEHSEILRRRACVQLHDAVEIARKTVEYCVANVVTNDAVVGVGKRAQSIAWHFRKEIGEPRGPGLRHPCNEEHVMRPPRRLYPALDNVAHPPVGRRAPPPKAVPDPRWGEACTGYRHELPV
jgi:hypothetical protein